MDTSLKNTSTTAHGYVSALETASGIFVVASAIALGVASIINSATRHSDDCDDMDTTERLLSGGNRDRILASLEEYNQGRFVEHNIEDLYKELA